MVLTWGVKIPLLGLWNHCRWWLQPWNQKMIASQQEIYDKPRQCTEKQRHYSADEDTFSQGYGLPSAHIVLWELGGEKGGAPKNWGLLAVVLEKTPESPSDCKEIKPAHLKGNQLWILIERTDAEAEVPAFWLPDVNSQLIGMSLMLGNIEGRRRRGLQKMRWLDGITDAVDMNLGKIQQMVRDWEACCAVV